MKLRVSSVQYNLKDIQAFSEFKHQIEHYIKNAKEFGSQIIVFPEFLTTQLMSILPDDVLIDTQTFFPEFEDKSFKPIDYLTTFTDNYIHLFTDFAKRYNIHIIGGTHVVKRENKLYNTSFLFYPDGEIKTQDKMHITPFEVNEWNIQKGNEFNIFEINGVKCAIIICYDIEFPELARIARAKGAEVIFNPFCTDDRQAFYRVRYSSHARAIENEVYVVSSGTVGTLTKVDYMRSNTGQAVVITPNDIEFPIKGILNEGELNQDMLITSDLDIEVLRRFRGNGSVQTWKDRRVDFYTDWE